ncbi:MULTISPECIES: DUF1803 domain-containing protein [unclassified Enterococcus]|uniref:DUF1803 domain-containing protein n=1 Tax=unclassified Enterococcus TaxID=2608891 RepID=UPI0015564AF6|nr:MULTISPECIES: DUF1803 domain-containing protein [unclassified Enterococcus]MBS7576692.1 DUF1803 domain-containing protein [Enterococcus sp. MMGLQ5-2]MBS7583821.1 DUF1803 domain-containing protein [Enterococcus sp. MMGLQ5-1]NPD11682.1 DUF1803 domain-containing protein [Enterococcus sp. MMGLQ5-1]NPD36529.1 DUF1803 domain-containing protein [Enterococcus sp. MMGLQ5-2]
MQLLTTDKRLKYDIFLKSLLELLNQSVLSLREIKAKYSEVSQIDRKIDHYIDLGLIKRENKRYYLSSDLIAIQDDDIVKSIAEAQISLLEASELKLNNVFFSQYFKNLQVVQPEYILLEAQPKLYRLDQLNNQTNQVVFYFLNQLTETELNPYLYFRHQDEEMLTEKEQEINQYLGDVNPEYGLKYMTTFLLKFLKKAEVTQKRPDIFVRALADFKIIEGLGQNCYGLKLPYIEGKAMAAPILEQLKAIEFDELEKLTIPERFITSGMIHQRVYDYFMTSQFAYWTIEA